MHKDTREVNVETHFRRAVKLAKGVPLKLMKLPGYPDRLVLFPGGHAYFVELKRPTRGRVARHQHAAHMLLRQMGFSVSVLRNREEIEIWLDRVRSETSTDTNSGP